MEGVKANIYYLEAFGFKRRQWERVFVEAPWTLRSDRDRLEAFLVYFHQTLRLSRNGIANLCAKHPRVASLHLGKTVVPCVQYFTQELQMRTERFVGMIEKHPRILNLSVEERIRPVVNFFLEELHIPKAAFVFQLRSFPGVLSCSLEKSVRFRARWLERVTRAKGDVLGCVCLRGLVLFETRSATLFRSYDALLHGLHHDAALAARILRRVPHILAWPPSMVFGQLRWVRERLGRDLTELYHFPALLGYSFKEHVLPRVELMERLGFDHERHPLFLLFAMPDDAFRDWIKGQHGRVELTERERERLLVEEMTHFEDEPLQINQVVSKLLSLPQESEASP